MIIGVPKERKDQKTRVAITPAGVKTLVDLGHVVLVGEDAGILSAFSNEEYRDMGARICGHSSQVWDDAKIILKIKEPIEAEYVHFRPGLTIFTYLHLAPLLGLTERLLQDRVTGIRSHDSYRRHGEENESRLCNPSYEVDGVIHYCVTDMPAAVPNTSTLALTNATFPFVALLANLGPVDAIKSNPSLAEGLNTYQGTLTCAGVAQSQGKRWRTPLELVA
jgi:alanine dehydrogenase